MLLSYVQWFAPRIQNILLENTHSCCHMQEQSGDGLPQPSLTLHGTEHGGSVRAEAPEETLTIEVLEQVRASCMDSRKVMQLQL